ncbi:hypothetical protein [Salsuginibacillus kocurii]|uniref:hypothetical protein n=1 Tax=Salsuginibacillus kocurii TaxID=427078 RepID=UPI00037638A9|nr:hypothetical protein [Salsuginibacillus kocurii]
MQVNSQQALAGRSGSNQQGSLQQGDMVKAKIVDRKSDREATIQVRGRELTATFENGVPKEERAAIQVKEKDGDRLKVRAVQEGSTNRSSGGESRSFEQTLTRMNGGERPSAELRQAARTLFDRGIPLNQESVQHLRRHMQQTPATQQAHMQTVQALASKKLEVTPKHLQAVHQALHGGSMSQALNQVAQASGAQLQPASTEAQAVREIAQELRQMLERGQDPSRVQEALRNHLTNNAQVSQDMARSIERVLAQTNQLQTASSERMSEALRMLEQASSRGGEAGRILQQLLTGGSSDRILTEVQQLMREGNAPSTTVNEALTLGRQSAKLQQNSGERLQQLLTNLDRPEQAANLRAAAAQTATSGQTTQSLEQARTVIQSETNINQAIQHVRDQVLPHVNSSQMQGLAERLETAETRVSEGRELSARKILSQIVEQTSSSQPASSTANAAAYSTNEQFQVNAPFESRVLVEERVTERLARLTDDFAAMRRDTARNLDQAARLIQTEQRAALPSAQQILDSTIKNLDRQIMRSDMMMIADMKTERQMMQASAQLAEAKKHLQRGQHQEAARMVREVQAQVERMSFEPTERKAKHFLFNDSSNQQMRAPSAQSANQQAAQVFQDVGRLAAGQDGSARQMFEYMRTLGLNREPEVAQYLAANRETATSSQDGERQRNLKHVLLQLAKDELEQDRAEKADETLQDLTGQQLLSKEDNGSSMESLFFTLPVLLQNQTEDLDVYVNARKSGEKLDWENSDLYFLIETPKLGKTGIHVEASDRALSVTLKNDQADFEGKMMPIVEKTTRLLEGVGYQVDSIAYAPLEGEEVPAEAVDTGSEQKKEALPIFTEKGFDYKV